MSGYIPPEDTVSVLLENCQQVELASRVFNLMPRLENITVRNSHTLILQQRVIRAPPDSY